MARSPKKPSEARLLQTAAEFLSEYDWVVWVAKVQGIRIVPGTTATGDLIIRFTGAPKKKARARMAKEAKDAHP